MGGVGRFLLVRVCAWHVCADFVRPIARRPLAHRRVPVRELQADRRVGMQCEALRVDIPVCLRRGRDAHSGRRRPVPATTREIPAYRFVHQLDLFPSTDEREGHRGGSLVERPALERGLSGAVVSRVVSPVVIEDSRAGRCVERDLLVVIAVGV